MSAPLIRNSGNSVPDWMLKSKLPNMDNKEAATASRVSSEDDLVEVRSRIEESVKTGKPIFVEKGMSTSRMAQLKEYAEVMGVDKSKIVEVSAQEKSMAGRVAVAEKVVTPPDRDPFGTIDSFASADAFKKNRDWDAVVPAQKLSSQGRNQSGIVGRVDGVETYEQQRIVGVRPGEASIAAPNAIKELNESAEVSNHQRMIESNEARRTQIAFDKKQWEKDVVDSLPDRGTIAMGGVKMTGAGQENSRMQVGRGQHSMFDEKDRNTDTPDRTAGEMLAEQSKVRKESIQRPKTDDRSWDEERSSKKPIMGDTFFEALKKQMAKVGK